MSFFLGASILIAAISAAASLLYWTLHSGISPMPSSMAAKKAFRQLLPTTVNGKILELGAGWGGLARQLADDFPDCIVEAYEISPLPYTFCCLCQWLWPRANLYFYRKDFFRVDFNGASLICCYLYPKAMELIVQKMERELTAPCLLASNTFGLRGKEPLAVILLEDLYHTKIYLYRLSPLKLAGDI